jgi:uncharacterized protein
MDESTKQFLQKAAASLRTDGLRLILLPTEQCNFRCTYCYEEHAPSYMSADIIRRVKRLIEHRLGGLHALRLSWFGGEPLLAVSVVEEISSHIVSAIKDRADIKYKAEMTTNGYLLELPVVERMLPYGVDRYQITLDGPLAVHDRMRVRANGSGSFHRIWNNLLAIRASTVPVKILLQIHLAPQNLSCMPEFLEEVRDTFLDDDRFSALLMPIGRFGGPNDETTEVLGEREKAQMLPKLNAVLCAGMHRDVLSPTPDICYASQHNTFVIRADGSICKCSVRLNAPENTVGRLLPDGTLEIDSIRQKLWSSGWETRETDALACPAAKIPRKRALNA